MRSDFQSTSAYHVSEVPNFFRKELTFLQVQLDVLSTPLQQYDANMLDVFVFSSYKDDDVIQIRQSGLLFVC